MEYSWKIFWGMRIKVTGIRNFGKGFRVKMRDERKDIMRNKNIQSCDLYGWRATGLFFGFRQLFFHIAFSFTRWLRYISVLAEVFHNIIIVYGIIYQWQNGTYCNSKHDKYGNEYLQRFFSLLQIYYFKTVLWCIYDECHCDCTLLPTKITKLCLSTESFYPELWFKLET